MIWRVIVKYKYNDLYFDFRNLEDAGNFANIVLEKYREDDDGLTDIRVVIEPMKIEEEEEKK